MYELAGAHLSRDFCMTFPWRFRDFCGFVKVELGTLSTSSFVTYNNMPGFDHMPWDARPSTDPGVAGGRSSKYRSHLPFRSWSWVHFDRLVVLTGSPLRQRSADLDTSRPFVHQVARPRSPEAGRVITQNSGGLVEHSLTWEPRLVGPRKPPSQSTRCLRCLGLV